MIRYVLFGSGWRAMSYVRLARLVPDHFELVSLYTHTPQRARELREQALPAVAHMDQALAVNHDLVIVASGPNQLVKTLCLLCERGEKVLSETSFLSMRELEYHLLWDLHISVMEQYWYTPLFSAVKQVLPLIGKIDQLSLSGIHCHHAASIIRSLFSLKDEMPLMRGSFDFPSRMIQTGDRSGVVLRGLTEKYLRSIRIMDFGNKIALYDQSSNQYHSAFLPLRFEIRGEKGVITERGVQVVDEEKYPCFLPFEFHTQRRFGNTSLALTHVTMGDKTLFANAYCDVNLCNDEIAMVRMIELCMLGKDPYPIQEAIRDARLGKMLMAQNNE